MQFYRSPVFLFEVLETLAQILRRIGDVRHDVRGKNDLAYTYFFISLQYREAVGHFAHSVVHSGQYMAVAIVESTQVDLRFFTEQEHNGTNIVLFRQNCYICMIAVNNRTKTIKSKDR